MSEKAPQLPQDLNAYNQLEAQVAADGSRRVYGIDGEGKKKQLKGDDVLEAYGYSAEEAQEAHNEFGEPVVAVEQDTQSEPNPYERIDDIKQQVDEIEDQRKSHAKWQMKVDTTEDKPSDQELSADDIAYNMWLEENAQNPDTQSKSLRDKAENLKADENKERMRAAANLGMRVKTGEATGEEAAYYHTLKEMDEAGQQSKEASESSRSAKEEEESFEGLTAAQLADELAFARITNSDRRSEIEDLLSERVMKELDEAELSEEQSKEHVASIRDEIADKEAQYLSQLDDLEMSDEEREHAIKFRQLTLQKQIQQMKQLTMSQREIWSDDTLSEEEKEAADDQLTSEFDKVLNRYATIRGLDEDQQQRIRDELVSEIIGDDVELDGPDEEGEYQPKHLREPKGLFDRMRNATTRAIFRFKSAKLGEKYDEFFNHPEKGSKRKKAAVFAGVALVGAAMLAGDVGDGNADFLPSAIDGDGMGIDLTGPGEPMDLNGEAPGVSAPEGSDAAGEAAAGSGGAESATGMEAVTENVQSNEGTSQFVKRTLGIDFGSDADKWGRFNELSNPLFEGMEGTYTSGGTVYFNEGANVTLSPELIEQLESIRDEVNGTTLPTTS